MAESDLLTRVLQACGQSAPAPMFPAEFASTTSLPRAEIDAAIDRLRINGYLQIADWVQGKGQGYTLTPAGTVALAEPIELRRPAVVEPPPEQLTLSDRRWQRGEAARNALAEPGPPIVTFVLIFANLAMYAIGLSMALLRGLSLADYLGGVRIVDVLDTLGAVTTHHVVIDNHWWRLLSYQFLHNGGLHLGMNMLALSFVGPLLEAVWGSKRFLILYLISGLVGGAAVVLASRAAVGASGPISGLMTSIGIWLWLNRDVLPEQISRPMMSRVGANLLLMVLISTMPNVSWEGHLGGAIGGILVSIAFQFQRFGVGWQKAVAWLALLAIPGVAVACIWFTYVRHRDDFLREHLLEENARQFHAVETYLLQRRNRFIVPVLRDQQGNWSRDAKFVAEFKGACQEGLTRLQPLLAKLAANLPAEDGKEKEETRNAQRYFEAWHELFQTLAHQLQQPERWNPARRRVLAEKDDALFDLRRPLEANTVLPRFLELVPAKEPPAPEGQPPRDVG